MVYKFDNIDDFINSIDVSKVQKKCKKGVYYYNLATSFDIETSNLYYDKNENTYISKEQYKIKHDTIKNYPVQKISFMYIWQFAINDDVITGRTWEEYKTLIHKLVIKFNTDEKNRLVIYVHNLSYEFQFIRKQFDFINVFAVDDRKPIYAITNEGIEYRCSYILSGYKLDTVAKNLKNNIDLFKLDNFDYNLVRNSKTVLTDDEIKYCINDVLIVTAYINECMGRFGNITKIPYTQTGIIRNLVRNRCFKDKKYRYMINKLTLDPNEFRSLRRAFMGGFTHASGLHSTMVCDDVKSYDFTSSYPSVMLSELYPMSKGKLIDSRLLNQDTFYNYLKNYCCIFDIQFTNIRPRVTFENIISSSKCYIKENVTTNNGRIVTGDKIALTITEIDFLSIQDFYEWDFFTIDNFYIYEKGFLPKPIIESILDIYEDKTKLKGVQGKETEYLHSKELLNSTYGMTVTNTIKDQYIYNGSEWSKQETDIETGVQDYNTNKGRFLFYPWGVYVTAYARRNLLRGILECKDDYIYSDTDSVKILNYENHIDFFNSYNNEVTQKIEYMCRYYGIDPERTRPRTIKNVSKPLGVWDDDGNYKHFKTLGAKRYIFENTDGSQGVTISGIAKKSGLQYLQKLAKENGGTIFDYFIDGLYFPDDMTGKLTHTYIDSEIMGDVMDYQGNTAHFHELSYIHLSEASFDLSISSLYLEYLQNIKDM